VVYTNLCEGQKIADLGIDLKDENFEKVMKASRPKWKSVNDKIL
jgi:hypothetical protein